MKIAIVGFGNMGCRHAQSLLQQHNSNNYFVAEPNREIFLKNLERIGSIEQRFNWVDSIDKLPDDLDLAIVATSSQPRYQITKYLIEKRAKYLLLEKIVFQNTYQFNEIIEMLPAYKSKIYCNLVNRYFPNYIEIKNSLQRNSTVIMNVIGGDFGLGCNALHYIDLFEYFTRSKAKLYEHKLRVNPEGNKRGENYKELLGEIVFSNENGDFLNISADERRLGGNEITIFNGKRTDVLNESSNRHLGFYENSIINKEFQILYTSFLTGLIWNDMLLGKALIPEIKDVLNSHKEFFKAANYTFGLSDEILCPLT